MRNCHVYDAHDRTRLGDRGLRCAASILRVLMSLSFAFLLSGVAPTRGHAELHTGTFGLFPGEGWDFSDSLITGVLAADIIFDVTTLARFRAQRGAATELLWTVSPAAILYVDNADSTYENLDSAPTDPDLYGSSEVAFVGDVFVVRTREAHYARIRVLPFGSILNLEYTYQDDGSPSFVPSVSVRATTWGAIKALYRR